MIPLYSKQAVQDSLPRLNAASGSFARLFFFLFVSAVLLSRQARTRVAFAMALLVALRLLLILVQLIHELLGVFH